MQNHIAIYHTWPETKNAEYENIIRIIDAAKNINLDVSVIDNQGYPIYSTLASVEKGGPRLTRKDCDFAISLHFESPKLNDFYTYYALWNPLDFYFVWGYDKSIRQFASHDDLLSCDSDAADAHALNIYRSLGRSPALPLPRLHHSLSGKVVKPAITAKSRVFYIGINWERINNSRGRHHELLVALDQADVIDIYGPELFHGVRPWEGYSCYRGSIPFDGRTTISRIAEAGICLAFSSVAHQKSGVMSNRLFEGLTAGALVIANTHPFLDKFFGDLIPTVDDSLPADQVISDVKRIVRWARANPAEATAKAQAAQKIFLEKFALENSLSTLMAQHAGRVAHWRAPDAADRTVTGIFTFTEQRFARFEEVMRSFAEQTHPIEAIIVVVDEAWYALNHRRVDALVPKLPFSVDFVQTEIFHYEGALDRHVTRKHLLGPAVWKALTKVKSEFFFIRKPEEDFFADHVQRLLAALTKTPRHLAAVSGVILENKGDEGRLLRRLERLAPLSIDSFIYSNEGRYSGNVLYSSRVIGMCDGGVFDLCDGQEHNYLNTLAYFEGGCGWTQSASYIHREREDQHKLAPIYAIEQQHQFIRDATAGFSSRLEIYRQPKVGGVVFTNAGGGQVHWGNLRRPSELGALVKSGTVYSLRDGGEGMKLLASGFAGPEPDGVWLSGLSGAVEFTLALTKEQLAAMRKVRFSFEASGRPARHTDRNQHATILVNGAPCAYLEIESRWATYSFDASRDLFEESPNVRLRFVLDHAENVLGGSGEVVDARLLGMRLASVTAEVL